MADAVPAAAKKRRKQNNKRKKQAAKKRAQGKAKQEADKQRTPSTSPGSDGRSEDENQESDEEEDEGREGYRKGGYHPVRLGEVYGNRFKVVSKLGWGHFSTVWLALDQQTTSYCALKIQKSADHYRWVRQCSCLRD